MVLMSLPPGAEMTTFFAPALMCFSALSLLVKKPVHSRTTSTPSSPHGSSSGLALESTLIFLPLITRLSPSSSAVPWKRPCAVSYLNRCSSMSAGVRSFTATTSTPLALSIWRRARRPMRPNPLMATLILIGSLLGCGLKSGRDYSMAAGDAFISLLSRLWVIR